MFKNVEYYNIFKNVLLKIYQIFKNVEYNINYNYIFKSVRYNSHAPTYIIFLGSYPRGSFGVGDLDFDIL